MPSRRSFTWVILITFLVPASSAGADEVRLINGDRLSGAIIRMEKELLFLKTTYAGELKIKWPDVRCIVSEKELPFVLKSKETLIGKATCPSEGVVQLEGANIGTSMPLALADITAVNPSAPSPVTYNGNIIVGGSMTEGNTDTKTFNGLARFQARSKRHRLSLDGKYNYGETDNEVTARNSLASFKYDFFVTKKIYSYVQSLFEKDAFQDLKLRSTAGLGVGYQFLDTERARLSAEAGISYFNEDFDTAEDRDYASGRWSVKFDAEVIRGRAEFFHFHEGYYSFEESSSYYIRSEQGFRLPIVDRFFANFQVDYKYNSRPAEGKEKADTAYIFGLGYDFDL